jgi:hypothetical protein
MEYCLEIGKKIRKSRFVVWLAPAGKQATSGRN